MHGDRAEADHFQAGATIADVLGKLGEEAAFGQLAFQGAIEKAVLDLLEDEPAGTVRAA